MAYDTWKTKLFQMVDPVIRTGPDLECFARVFAGISPWISKNERRLPILDFFEKVLDEPLVTQSIVEYAHICYGFLLSNNILWSGVSVDIQTKFITNLKSVRKLVEQWQLECNWYLFHGIIEAFLKSIGDKDYDSNFVSEMIQVVDNWYCGDGFYFDGLKGFRMDYYNSYVIHPFFIEILRATNSIVISRAVERCKKYAEQLERLIGPDGTYPPLGRSILYRFGAFHALSYCIYKGYISKNHRRALTKVLTKIMNDNVFDETGMLVMGFTGKQEDLADYYSTRSSCYLATLGFLPLGLDETHPFWTDAETPFTQELAWTHGTSFTKYDIDETHYAEKTLFLISGDRESAISLAQFLNVPFGESEKSRVVVAYSEDSIHVANTRTIKIYVGLREDVDCITVFPGFQESINIFCLKCLEPRRTLLVSPGGSACTAFLEFLGKTGIVINSPNSAEAGRDGLKHSLADSKLVEAYNPTHIIYQYGDLDATIRSLFRRNILEISYFYDYPQKFMHPLKRRTKREVKFQTFEDYITHVVTHKEEPLGIVKHWNSWRAVAHYKNIIFIHYKDIHRNKDIDKFLGLPEGTCAQFTVKERESKILDIETPTYLDIIKNIIRD